MRMRCPHAESDMTPCYMKDGKMALCHIGSEETPTHCVGCERSQKLLDVEKRKLQRGQQC